MNLQHDYESIGNGKKDKAWHGEGDEINPIRLNYVASINQFDVCAISYTNVNRRWRATSTYQPSCH